MNHLKVYETCVVVDILTFVNYYRISTPGISVCTSPPVILNGQTVYPHVVAQVNFGSRKQCSVNAEGAFDGAPNFVAEVFPKDSLEELDSKLELYQNAGVQEFLAWQRTQPLFRYYRLRSGKLSEVTEDERDLIKSQALPGLWINLPSIKTRNWKEVLRTIDAGVQSEEHNAFVADVLRK